MSSASSSQQFLHSVGAALLAQGKVTLEAACKGLAAVGQEIGQEMGQELGFSLDHYGTESPDETSSESSPRDNSTGGESLRGESHDSGSGSGWFSRSSGAQGGTEGRRRGRGEEEEDGNESDSAWEMDGADAAWEEGSYDDAHMRTDSAEGEGEDGVPDLPDGVMERAKGHLAALTAELTANKADLAEAYAMLAKAGFDWVREQREKARLQEQVADLSAALEALQASCGGTPAALGRGAGEGAGEGTLADAPDTIEPGHQCPPDQPGSNHNLGSQAGCPAGPSAGTVCVQGIARTDGEEGGKGADVGEEKEVVRLRRELAEERALRARERQESQSAQAVVVGSLKWVIQVKEEVEREKEEMAKKCADLDAAQEELDREREELRQADSWREYNVRVKLLDAQMELGARVGALEELESAFAQRLLETQNQGNAGLLTLTQTALLTPEARDTLHRILAPFQGTDAGSGPMSPAPSAFDVIYGSEGAVQAPQKGKQPKGEEEGPEPSLRDHIEAEEDPNARRTVAAWDGAAPGLPLGQGTGGASALPAPCGRAQGGDMEARNAHGAPGVIQEVQASSGGAGPVGPVFSSLVEESRSSRSLDGESRSLSSPRSLGELCGSSSSSSDGFGAGLQQPPLCLASIQAYVAPLLGSPESDAAPQSIWDFVSGASAMGNGGGRDGCSGKGGRGRGDVWKGSEAKRHLPALHDSRAAKMRGSSRGSGQPCVAV